MGMGKEVDINAVMDEHEMEEAIIMFSGQKEPEWEVYRHDVNLHVTFFGNPICWLRLGLFWNPLDGYGIRVGPLQIIVQILKFTKYKRNKNE